MAGWRKLLASLIEPPHSHSALQDYKERRHSLPIHGMKVMSVCCRCDGAAGWWSSVGTNAFDLM
jgi:hypothetical protein